ncbi:caspase domain-containing protein [Fomitopsis betulina]|nr:caspase domain-containing protein [Fomitopsis betulina]
MHAMIVAINNYPNMPLRGCVADGRAMVDFVKTKLHVPESQIVTLFDEAASREAILSTFKTHFTDNDAVAKGDGIVFFYAGHGTQEDAPDDWGLDGEIPVECICPQDLNWETVHAIPSTTLNALFRELAYAKGDNITAIFDCCHSGQITRTERGLRYMLPPPDLNPKLPSALDADVHKWWPDHYGHRSAKSVLPTSFRYDTMQSHVLLSACRANEQASECALGKTREMRGWFTSTLLEILDEHEDSTAGLTYAYLFDVLLSSKARPLQHPQCLGKHKNRLLWNTTIKMSDGFPITVCEGRIVVHAGRVHGIAPRTTFVVQDDTDRRLGTLVVAELQDLRCECQCGDAPFEVAIGSRAIVKDWNNEDLSLDVYVDPELTGRHTFGQSAIPEALRDCIRVVDAPEPADLAIIKAGSDTTTLERRDPLLREFANNIAVDLDKHHIQDVISAVLHFNFHLYRRYPEPWNLLSAVRLEMYKVKQERADQPQTHYVEADTTNFFARNHEVPAYKAFAGAVVQGATMNDLEALYGLKIVNDSSFDLFPYIFYFDPDDYSIQTWYQPESPSSAPPLRAHDSLKANYGLRSTGKELIKLSLPPGKDLDTGFVKLFVSTSYVDMQHIPKRGYKNWRKAAQRGPAGQGERWSTFTYVLTCQRAP